MVGWRSLSTTERSEQSIAALLFNLRANVGGSAPTGVRRRPRSARPHDEKKKWQDEKMRGASHAAVRCLARSRTLAVAARVRDRAWLRTARMSSALSTLPRAAKKK
jgi:hypothetical protein